MLPKYSSSYLYTNVALGLLLPNFYRSMYIIVKYVYKLYKADIYKTNRSTKSAYACQPYVVYAQTLIIIC